MVANGPPTANFAPLAQTSSYATDGSPACGSRAQTS